MLLLAPDDRLLLFHAVGGTDGMIWVPPGGGLDPGESHAAAAARELWEETGQRVPVGPCVWRRRFVVRWFERVIDSREQFFVARTATTALSRAGWEPHEHALMRDLHWWSLAELRVSDAVFVPRRLADLLPPLLAGHYPNPPLEIGA